MHSHPYGVRTLPPQVRSSCTIFGPAVKNVPSATDNGIVSHQMTLATDFSAEMSHPRTMDNESSSSRPVVEIDLMVARDGVEPPTPAFSGLRSTT
jgi:hypothetical protein